VLEDFLMGKLVFIRWGLDLMGVSWVEALAAEVCKVLEMTAG